MADLKQTSYLSRLLAFENESTKRGGVGRMQRYHDAFAYFTGDNQPPDSVEQPLHINYLGAVCEKHNAYLWGQWEDQDIVTWRVRPIPADNAAPTEDERRLARHIARWITQLFQANHADSLLYEAGLNGAIFGDTFLKVHWDPVAEQVLIESVLPEYVHVRWDPQNLLRIEEVIVAYPIERRVAQERFGTYGSADPGRAALRPEIFFGLAVYWERWTAATFQQWIDDELVADRPNPYGAIPFVHIPNLRVGGEFYGFEDSYRAYDLQDELNRGFSDQSDIVNNHAHPITLLNNFFGNVDQLPVGPDQVWNLGREGKASYLQWDGSPPAVMDYLTWVREMLFDTAMMSDVAFGRHKGTQQSGMALTVEMGPVVDRAKWKRILWTVGLRQLVQLAATIAGRMNRLPFPVEALQQHQIRPIFAPILPRDRMTQVNETIAKVANYLSSIRRGLEELGIDEVDEEYHQIFEEMERRRQLGSLPQQGGLGGVQGSAGQVITRESARKGRPEA